MLSDPVLLGIINSITPVVTAIAALIIALRTKQKVDIHTARRDRRRSDKPKEPPDEKSDT